MCFNLINPKTNNRIKLKTVDAGTGEELSREDLVKGFAVAKDEYVVLDKEDFESVKLDEAQGHGGDRPPRHEHAREGVCHRDRGGWPCPDHPAYGRRGRTLDEIGHPDLPKPNAQMLDIAEKIVAQQSGDFDPAEFTDRYEDVLRALIEEKMKGKPVKAKPPFANEECGVVGLMAALKKSLLGNGPERKRAGAGAAPPLPVLRSLSRFSLMTRTMISVSFASGINERCRQAGIA